MRKMNEHIFHLIDLQELTRIFSLLKKMLTKSPISYQSPRIYPKIKLQKKKEEIREYLPRRSFFTYSCPLIFFLLNLDRLETLLGAFPCKRSVPPPTVLITAYNKSRLSV